MKACWVIGIVMAAGVQAQPHECGVDVYLEASVPVPPGMLPDAALKVTGMFREIGVNVRIRYGIPSRDPASGCGAPMVLKLEHADGRAGAFAYAEPYKKSGTCVHVFIDRVILSLSGEPTFSNALLAHVMAHEITHVLERINRHSNEGLMKGEWSQQDHARMKRHPLPFAPEDVQLIRQGLAWRAAQSATE